MKIYVAEKSCANCSFYSQHFSKWETCYRPVNCGHCLNLNVDKKSKKTVPFYVCEYWEDIEIKKEARKQTIKETLRAMSERLNEIALILEDDKK